MGKIMAVCLRGKKSTQKKKVHEAVGRGGWGIEGEAHAGERHRQGGRLFHYKMESL